MVVISLTDLGKYLHSKLVSQTIQQPALSQKPWSTTFLDCVLTHCAILEISADSICLMGWCCLGQLEANLKILTYQHHSQGQCTRIGGQICILKNDWTPGFLQNIDNKTTWSWNDWFNFPSLFIPLFSFFFLSVFLSPLSLLFFFGGGGGCSALSPPPTYAPASLCLINIQSLF